MRRVYGPVPSRRFGLSLGVDLLPRKLCTCDCVYCQVGPTTECTLARRDFFPLDDVVSEVRAALTRGPRPEAITLSGSGEPTLYRSLGELIARLHGFGLPVVLLTKGVLLHDPQVLEAALTADVLKLSLDAPDEGTWRRVNRPAGGVAFDRWLRSVREAARRHRKARLEVMLIRGLNDDPGTLEALAGLLSGIDAEIDINTPVRPAPGRDVQPSLPATLEAAARLFGPRARVVAEAGTAPAAGGTSGAEEVLAVLSRRPCTAADLSTSLGLPLPRVKALLKEMEGKDLVEGKGKGRTRYYYARTS